MSEIFLKIVNMSISASWLVLAVLLLRLVLKKAPKWVSVLLWGFVAVRLICPFSFESVLSLIPSAQTVSPGIMMDWTPGISTGIAPLDQVVNPIISASFTPNPAASANPLQILIPVLGNVWLLGIVAMLAYTGASYLLLWRRVATAVLLKENIFQSENVDSPFVLGIIKPRIYLPFRMDGQNLEHVIAHEESHIRRKDHWWKPFGFLLLAVHWFNPLMWVGYILLCRDIELACDEKVIKEMDNEAKADYTQALVACSVNRRSIAACPLAFGEVGVKARVRSIMNYRKPAFWLTILALVICTVVAVCFLTDPVTGAGDLTEAGWIAGQPYGVVQVTYENPAISYTMVAGENTPQYKIDDTMHLYSAIEHSREPKWTDLGMLAEMELAEDTFDKLFMSNSGYGWLDGKSASAIRENTVRAWQVSYKQENLFYYILQQKNGELYLAYGYCDPDLKNPAINWLYLLARQTVMIPTDTELHGFQGGYLLLPMNGKTYRYDLTDRGPAGFTTDKLLYKFLEPETLRNMQTGIRTRVAWQVYSLKEYPDRSVVLAYSATNGQWLCTYSPPRSCSDTALADAIKAGYAVMENGIATHGQKTWNQFYELTQQGKSASVTVAHYQQWENISSDRAYYEAAIQDYPYLNVYQLSFDGEVYTLSFIDGGQQHTRTFEYLMKYETVGYTAVSSKKPPVIDRYVLTHDEHATWDELWKSLASSAEGIYIDHYSIYTEEKQ